MVKKINLILIVFIFSGCSLTFIKKRLSPPHKVGEGILFQYDAPSARHVNLAGNFPDNEWLKHGDKVDIMRDDGKNGDKIEKDGIWSIVKISKIDEFRKIRIWSIEKNSKIDMFH